MGQDNSYDFQHYPAMEAAINSEVVKAISHVFSNSFGNNPEGKPYRLGPKTTKARLESTGHVIVAQTQMAEIVGYLYARVINYSSGIVGWIDSVAVMPNHRRKKVATYLVDNLISRIPESKWVGCATPNPIAAFVITKVVKGTAYVGECNPPQEVIEMINEIRAKCPDISGVDFNHRKLLVRTNFSPVSSEDTTEWSPPHPTEPPLWWASLKNLPSDYEALLIIDRDNNFQPLISPT
ncbi:MAG: GNAT family N-acetyltransferase [Nitrospirae bacterium]|nr:GNAT family N-acetyltransferase [Nitrospirota bacterium]MDA1305236.1 GNAT family N-acetyltransferase [Nitrospirota bacterium]